MTTDTINILTLIHAPVEQVWDAWTDPVVVLKWFGSDPEGCGLKAMLDVRPGGKFEVTFSNADGTQHTCYGVYVAVIKPFKISFTWIWKSEPGIESFVTVKLIPVNEFTYMQFEHARVGTASAHNYSAGWTTTFQKLEKLLTSLDNNVV